MGGQGPAAPRPMIKVAIVDDQALVRSGFRMILEAQPDIEVVAEASTGDEAVDLSAAVPCDLMLMDIRMPGLDGIAATHKITKTSSGPRVLILTTFDLDEYVYAAI